MIDFVRFGLPVSYKKQFLENSSLTWKKDVQKGIHLERHFEFYKLKVIVYTKQVVVAGSVHSYYNFKTTEKWHNYDDFSLLKLERSLEMLANELDFKLEDTIIQNLEFGVNIELTQPSKTILERDIVCCRYLGSSVDKSYGGVGRYKQFEFSSYQLKIYDKGSQFNVGSMLLRVELKTKRSSYVTKGRSWTLLDLLDRTKLSGLLDKILDVWRKTTLCDQINEDKIKDEKDLSKLRLFKSSSYWVNLKSKGRQQMTRRRMKKFEGLMAKYGLDSMHKEIAKKVKEKWLYLMSFEGDDEEVWRSVCPF